MVLLLDLHMDRQDPEKLILCNKYRENQYMIFLIIRKKIWKIVKLDLQLVYF